MSKSRRLSIASAGASQAPCRIEWQPSRWVGVMTWSLALLAPFSLLASDLPRGVAWPLALAAITWAVFDANRYRRRPRLALLIPAGHGQARCNGVAIDGLRVEWRGPLAFLSWQIAGGPLQRASFWPDTLDHGQRRELRLALMRTAPAREVASMAG